MVDMHSHILFGVDDGPETVEETIRMLEKAVAEGITEMIATPHACSPHFHVPAKKVTGQIDLLADIIKAAEIPITVHTGQEVRLHEEIIDTLKKNEILTLAKSRYLLLELPSQSIPAYTTSVIQSLAADDIIPIIAHPERNRAIAEKPERLENLIRHGALAQITAGSVAGYFGKNVRKIAMKLIESNLIHTYGSDVHNLETRPFLFNEGLDYLEKKKQLDIIDILLENNERIIRDEPFIILDPITPKNRKWWQIIG